VFSYWNHRGGGSSDDHALPQTKMWSSFQQVSTMDGGEPPPYLRNARLRGGLRRKEGGANTLWVKKNGKKGLSLKGQP